MKPIGRWPQRLLAIVLALAGLCIYPFAQATNDFRFCILGDRTGDAQPGVYERVWQDVDAQHPDFVINAGDTIQGGNEATLRAEWQALRPLWNRFHYPIYFTPGNHDIWSAESRKTYEKEAGHPAFYSFDFQSAHFTVLDNSQTEDLSDEQMQFLAHDLEAHKSSDPKFVFFHKPFWLIPVKFLSREFPFHQLIQRYGVRFVISGHTHRYESSVDDGVVYMEMCSSGGRLKGTGFAEGWFFGYAVARVAASKVEITVRELSPPFGQGRSVLAARPDH